MSQDMANHGALTDDVNQITHQFQDLEGIKRRTLNIIKYIQKFVK